MQGKEAMVKANMLPTFSGLLHHQRHHVQQRALCAIMLLCVVVDAKKQVIEIPMLIDHLVYILVVGEDGVRYLEIKYIMLYNINVLYCSMRWMCSMQRQR